MNAQADMHARWKARQFTGIDFAKLPHDIQAQLKLAAPNQHWESTSVREAFELWCNWEGIIGYADTLMRVLHALEGKSDDRR